MHPSSQGDQILDAVLHQAVKRGVIVVAAAGNPELKVGIIDGPVAIEHPDLRRERLHEISDGSAATCNRTTSTACLHGTFITGILAATRNSAAPAICPDCTFLVRPIFSEPMSGNDMIGGHLGQRIGGRHGQVGLVR